MVTAFKRHHDLVRLLNLLPYFEAHPGRSMMEAAADLGLTPAQVQEDLARLFCCGPGIGPDELVDMDANLRSVRILDNQGMDAPLRLTRTEAAALLLALENLENVPGLVDRTAVVSAANKLRDIMGLETVAVFDSAGEELFPETMLDTIRASMEQRVQLLCTYNSATRGIVKDRALSVVRLFTKNAQGYITAFDHDHNEHRTFRLDRLSEPRLSTERATPRTHEINFDPNDPFGFNNSSKQALLEIEESSLWLTETLPVTIGEETADGYVQITLPLVDEQWLIQFALSHADRVRVVEPREIATQVSLRAQSGLSLYDLPMNQ